MLTPTKHAQAPQMRRISHRLAAIPRRARNQQIYLNKYNELKPFQPILTNGRLIYRFRLDQTGYQHGFMIGDASAADAAVGRS